MTDIDRIGIVGAGSMGTEMSLLFAEKNIHTSLFDVNTENIDKAIERAKKEKLEQYYNGYKDYESFVQSFPKGKTRVFLFSITHGKPVDEVLDSLIPLLKKHDEEETIIIDGGNEWYQDTEKRQKRVKEELGDKVKYIGMGVSGGYQSARRGPSISPGGDRAAYDRVEGFLQKFAAKSDHGPCVTYVGPGGAGHYVKMVHNGIEQGMLSITCEIYMILKTTLGLSNDRIGKIFEDWVSKGELKGNFLYKICGEICQRKTEDGKSFVLDDIEDKVTQDVDDSEGTGVWTVIEASARHVPCPSIAEAHFLRLISSDRPQRRIFGKNTNVPKPQQAKDENPEEWIETLRKASYGAFLTCFVQGCNLIAVMSKQQNWRIKLSQIMKIYRAGCIIQSDYIIDVLENIFKEGEKDHDEPIHLNTTVKFAEEVNKTIQDLKKSVLFGIQYDANVPALASSWEYLKYMTSEELPTHLMEAQLDYFGAHHFTWKSAPSEERDKIAKGKGHIVWKDPY